MNERIKYIITKHEITYSISKGISATSSMVTTHEFTNLNDAKEVFGTYKGETYEWAGEIHTSIINQTSNLDATCYSLISEDGEIIDIAYELKNK